MIYINRNKRIKLLINGCNKRMKKDNYNNNNIII